MRFLLKKTELNSSYSHLGGKKCSISGAQQRWRATVKDPLDPLELHVTLTLVPSKTLLLVVARDQ